MEFNFFFLNLHASPFCINHLKWCTGQPDGLHCTETQEKKKKSESEKEKKKDDPHERFFLNNNGLFRAGRGSLTP